MRVSTDQPPPSSFESARQHFLEGLALLEAGAFDRARVAFEASLQLVPGRSSTLINLAATLLRLDEPALALSHADAVLRQDRDAVEAWLHRAHALAQLNQHAHALAAFDEVHARDAAHAMAWTGRGHVLREVGRLQEAADAFKAAVVHGGDATLHAYYLSAVSDASTLTPIAARPPRTYVESLFDSYADGFDQHLTQSLGYDAHEHLAKLLIDKASSVPRPDAVNGGSAAKPWRSVLDLGCGTGLSGPYLHPYAHRLVGLDVSSGMLAKARERAIYDELVHDDASDWLARTEERFDVVVATDVFIYVGDLAAVFSGVQRVLSEAPSATYLAFTLECPDDLHQGFRLMANLRYAHSLAYVRALARKHGLAELACESGAVRREQGLAVPGHYLVFCGPHTGGGGHVPQYVR